MARRLIVCLVLATPLLMASCAPEPTATPDLVATEVAVQKAAAATLTAEAPTPTHTPAQAETAPIPSATGTFPPTDTPVASDTPIPSATATFPPTDTPSPAPGFTIYENRSLGFSAEYPEGWGVQVHDFQDPQTGEVIGKAAEFYSPDDPEGSLLQLMDIAVQVIAGIPGAPARIPTDEEYKQFITDWVIERQQEVVTEPTLITVDGYTAVQVTYTGTDVFEKYSLVGYGTVLMTEDRFVFVEGVAATENQEELRNIYAHFMSTFDVLPLTSTTQPTATARPTNTATPVVPGLVPATPTVTNIGACPATVACVEVINYCGTSIYFTIAGEMHTVNGNSSHTIELSPGEYTYTVSLPGHQSINDVIAVLAGATYSLPFTADVG